MALIGHLRLEVKRGMFRSFEAILGHLRSCGAVRATFGHSRSIEIISDHLRSLGLFVARSGHSGLFGVILSNFGTFPTKY